MKAVLVLDEMPIRCGDCILKRWSLEKSACECYPLRKAIDPLLQDFDKYPAGEGRPDWCPLKELPEREINYHIMDDDIESIRFDYEGTPAYMTGHEDGWNECLDAIEGKED